MRGTRLIVALVLSAAAVVAAVPAGIRQQKTGEPYSTAIAKLKNGLYVIPGYDGQVTGGNVAVRVTSEGVLLVDDKFPPNSREIAGKVKSVTSLPILYVLSTHHHGDHTGGHPEFIKTTEIIAHRNARANMVKAKLPGLPQIVFTDQTEVYLGDTEVQAFYFGRGHTNGDAVIYFRDLRTVHTGDLVVWGKRSDGTVLTPSLDYAYGGSLTDWLVTLDKVLQLDFDTAIPGHGPVVSKDDVRTFRQKLGTLRQRAAELVKSGASKNDFVAKLKTDDLNWPFPKATVEGMFDELSATR